MKKHQELSKFMDSNNETSEWKECCWGDIATLEYGKSLRDYKNKEGKYPVYGTNGQIGCCENPLVNQKGVIIGRKGAYRGVHYSKDPFFVIDTAFYLKPKNEELIDIKFAYYELLTHDINSLDSGSAIPSTSREDFYSLPIKFPLIDEQKMIVKILETLDDKIDLNNHMNKTLEQIAQTLFKRWFINFEFPDENGNPYKSSGGRMVDSELGELPEGWGVKKVDEILELAYGKALKEDIRIPGSTPVYGSNGQVGWHNQKLVDGPGIVVGRKGNPGTVNWIHTHFYPIDTTFYVITKGPVKSLYYILYALKKQELPSLAADSAVPGLNRNMVYMNKMIVPERDVLDLFDVHLNNIYQKIQVNEEQSRILGSIRDSLLPKLMLGKIRV